MSQSIIAQPCAFSIRLGTGDQVKELIKKYPAGTPFTLAIDGTLQITGTTDGYITEGSTGGTEFTLRGRDRLKSLLDAYVEEERSWAAATYAVLPADILPGDMRLATLFERVEIALEHHEFDDLPVYFGGPVQSVRGFVLHRPAGNWHSSLTVNESVGLTSSRDVLQSLASAGEPSEILVALGYASWSAGHLEHELAQNAWLTVPADLSLVFQLPAEERLAAAMQLLGVDFAKLSDIAGHA